MNSLFAIVGKFRKFYPYFFLPLILIYLTFNILDGNNGLLSHAGLDTRIMNLENDIHNIKNQNNLYEIKIATLKKVGPDSDLADEQIRNVLGYGKNSEFIVFFEN
tara:strand:- start:535 stop:849 length:315 start_codon:yes stop_codon:yes gene_type:complete